MTDVQQEPPVEPSTDSKDVQDQEAIENTDTELKSHEQSDVQVIAQESKTEPESVQQEKSQESQAEEPQPLSINNELSDIAEASINEKDTETILRNGIPVPKDSELFQSIDISYNPLQNLDISSALLIKANLASLPLTLQAHDSLPIRVQFLIHSIPVLDNISTQILRMIGVGPYEETLAIITSEEPTPEGLVYKDLVELFEQVKRVFSDEDPFLGFPNLIEDVDGLELAIVQSLKELEDPIDSAFRKANLATFLLATLGSIEVGFFYLNESFLDVFCPTHNSGWFKSSKQASHTASSITAGKLLKAQAALFLELKTQAYISALESGDRSKIEVLDDIFPDDMKEQLLERRQSSDLSPAEQYFLQRCKSRYDTLLTTPDDQDLSEHYEWLIFLKELFNYVSKNIGFLIWGRKGRHTVLTTIGAALNSSTPTPDSSNIPYASLSKDELQKRLELQKEKERELKERDEKETQEQLEQQQQRAQLHQKTKQPKTTGSSSSSSMTASAQRRQKPPSTTNPPRLRHILRRLWAPEEESALIEALKENGPQWSKILEFYGAGGSKSEALKNRTQVQLKDKARNWKMGFLKSKGEVPEYLSKVTGDLSDDRSQKKRKRSEATQANSDGNKKTRSKSPVAQEGNPGVEQSRERVVQQESSVRTEIGDHQETEKEQPQGSDNSERRPIIQPS